MTTITREHLELAAKAAGYGAVTEDENGWFRVEKCPGEPELWQPHEDPFDAWHLAVDCDLAITFERKRVVKHMQGISDIVIEFGPGKNCTAAEAVTLAAAEIGRAIG